MAGMISHIKTMIPVFGRIGFGRDEIYPDVWINMKMMSMVYCWLI